jgi:hypothetical protein
MKTWFHIFICTSVNTTLNHTFSAVITTHSNTPYYIFNTTCSYVLNTNVQMYTTSLHIMLHSKCNTHIYVHMLLNLFSYINMSCLLPPPAPQVTLQCIMRDTPFTFKYTMFMNNKTVKANIYIYIYTYTHI